MARVRERSPSPDSTSAAKRPKNSHTPPSTIANPTAAEVVSVENDGSPAAQFAPALFDHDTIANLHAEYVVNEPFKYTMVKKLFRDELLKKVKDECLSELNFTEKETDIYKVNQTGDLASLNYLSPSQISLLPNLLTLRDALYSPVFRSFLQAVTGCGPLSGTKQDMSVNSYTKGCHLLNHDDVIGTRRVSYILYMPLPNYQFWQKEWGGGLELYPVKMGQDGQMEPEAAPQKCISPSWNQFIFFEVQPGRSFHSVEEVVVGGEVEDGRERLSISGWFHAAQEGEEGYVPELSVPEVKSSREQLASTSTVFKSYSNTVAPPHPDIALSEEHISFLSEFLNPVYLQPRTMSALSARFADESSLELHSFLSNALAESLEPRLRELDTKDGLGSGRAGQIPPHSSSTSGAWRVKGPPHKWRYCVLSPHKEGGPAEAVSPRSAQASDEVLRSLQDELFPSPAFRAWMATVSRLLPLRYSAEARRFRPGLDYTLATSEERECRLDVVLGLTPEATEAEEGEGEGEGEGSSDGQSLRKAHQKHARGWQAAEWGGWECYMAPHNEEDDPAVYRASTHKKSTNDDGANGAAGRNTEPETDAITNSHAYVSKIGNGTPDLASAEDSEETEEEEEEEEDSTLLTVQPGFNRLLLVLRDERVMRFVKYVSAAAEGSRWDICGEYEVGMMREQDDDDDP